jgi:hypothetical protein
MNLRNAYLISFALAVTIISYYDVHTCHRLPWPPRIVLTGLVFAMLDLFSLVSPELAGVIAVGVVLALIVNKGFVCTDPAKCCKQMLASATAQPTDDSIFLQSPTYDSQSTSTGGNLDINNLPKPGPGQTLT